MYAQEALDSLIATLSLDLEPSDVQEEIAVLSRAAETQDKLDWQREMCAGVELPEDDNDRGIWAEN